MRPFIDFFSMIFSYKFKEGEYIKSMLAKQI